MRKFVLLLGCFAASPLAAGETKLNGETIKATLSGSRLALDTPIGTTVSVRIGHDGLMSGEAGTALGAVLGSPTDRGRWWVVNDQVCFKWFRWFDAEERCVTFSVDGNRFAWQRDNGDSGTGTIVERGKPIAKPAVIVAQAEKRPEAAAQKPVAKKADILVAANDPKPATSKTLRASSKPVETHAKPSVAAMSAPVVAPKTKQALATSVALNVPAPRPAVRPKHHEAIVVAAVKPQFFKTANAGAARIDQKPFRVAGVDPSDVLYIRNGPSSDYQSVGGIPSNSHGITITGRCLNDWCPVKHRLLVGWVNRRYLAEETTADASASADPNYWNLDP